MALSAARLAEAKSEARDFLEYSIFVLCTFLSIDPETVTGDMVIPVSEDDTNYSNYLALKRQVTALEALGQ